MRPSSLHRGRRLITAPAREQRRQEKQHSVTPNTDAPVVGDVLVHEEEAGENDPPHCGEQQRQRAARRRRSESEPERARPAELDPEHVRRGGEVDPTLGVHTAVLLGTACWES
ncbi:hypothetical protein TruAng_009996 [Truncatella angustata]|nr:hypothetical protein TruAng_009996 [Truncatella angustata]